MSEKLKPCPFCGGEAEMQITILYNLKANSLHFIHCGKCWSSTFQYFSKKEEAIKAWNTRVGEE